MTFKAILRKTVFNIFYLSGVVVFIAGAFLCLVWRVKSTEQFTITDSEKFISFIIGTILCIVGVGIIKFGRRVRTTMSFEKVANASLNEIAKDPELILYLRSFKFDKKLNSGKQPGISKYIFPYFRWLETEGNIESDLGSILMSYGKPLALESPNRIFAFDGISRMRIHGDNWKDFIVAAIKHCKIIFLISGTDTDGLNWELEQIFAAKATNKLIIYFIKQKNGNKGFDKFVGLHNQYFNKSLTGTLENDAVYYYDGRKLEVSPAWYVEESLNKIMRLKIN